jgi:uncharacterized protein (DUF433 family)
MGTSGVDLIGVGLYAVPEATRLTGVSGGRIRRWLRGYTFRTGTGLHKSHPVIAPALPPIDDTLILTFLELLEIRMVDAFLNVGVKWKTIREARDRARSRLGEYPFSRGNLVTDGREIFEPLARGSARNDTAFVNVVTSQFYFRGAVAPYLAVLKFSAEGQAEEWWPLGKSRSVVLNPRRSFGQPIVARGGVSTNILARLYKAERSFTRVARWYNVSERAVRDAVEYESSLAA